MRSVVGRVGLEPPTSALAQPHRSASGIVDQLRVHRCGAVLSGVDELSSKAVAGALGKELCTYNPRMLGPDERLAVERGIHPRQRDQVGGGCAIRVRTLSTARMTQAPRITIPKQAQRPTKRKTTNRAAKNAITPT